MNHLPKKPPQEGNLDQNPAKGIIHLKEAHGVAASDAGVFPWHGCEMGLQPLNLAEVH
jgi:hypothetical protein